MDCIKCNSSQVRVIDTRAKGTRRIYRRRVCMMCGCRWTTVELPVGDVRQAVDDRYTAQYLVQDMKQYGFHMDDVFQGFNLTPVIREVEGLLKDGTINIGDNDLLKVHLLNTALKVENDSGRCKLVKMSAADHIDGCAALMDGMTVRQKWCAEIGGQLKNAG